MRKIFALIAVIAVTVIFGSWVWTYTYHPLLPMVVIALVRLNCWQKEKIFIGRRIIQLG